MKMIAVGVVFNAAGGPMVGIITEQGEILFTAIVAQSLVKQLRCAVESINEWDDMETPE